MKIKNPEVRGLKLLPRQDETRTIVNSIVEELMLYFAA